MHFDEKYRSSKEAKESEKEVEEKRNGKNLKTTLVVDSSEVEKEDDEEELREDDKGFINDEEAEDDDSGSDSEVDTDRRRKRDDDDDDDLDLIAESIEEKRDFKEEDDTGAGSSQQQQKNYASEEEEEHTNDDDNNFIVDNDDQPIAKTEGKVVFENETMEAARDIIGSDFDCGESRQFEDLHEGENEEKENDKDYKDDEGERRDSHLGHKERKTAVKKSTYEVFEPSELERCHLTDQDQQIRKLDIPERFQMRQIPVTRTRVEGDDRDTDKELDQEAKWIYYHAFCKPFISNQGVRDDHKLHLGSIMVQKIANVLDLIRNSSCEVPFIAFYRKEDIEPELNIRDLWKIYRWDEKWCQLQLRKGNLRSRFQMMAEYQNDKIINNPEVPLPESFRFLYEDDIKKIDEIETPEQFNGCYKQYMLYYGKDQAEMQAHFKAKRKVMKKVKKMKRKKNLIIEDDEDELGINKQREEEDIERKTQKEKEKEANRKSDTDETESEEEVETEFQNEYEDAEDLKSAVRRQAYELLSKVGIGSLAQKFGLTPEQYGQNVLDGYQHFDVDQCPDDPLDVAENYTSKMCRSPEAVLGAAVRMVGWQLASEPSVRRTIRDIYFERAKIIIRLTPLGKKLTEHHPLYVTKYLTAKPVADLQADQFLCLKYGMEDKLITVSFSDNVEGNTSKFYLNELKQLYYRDEFSKIVQDWNELRGRAVSFAFKCIIEDLKKELSQRLLEEAKLNVAEQCCLKLYNWIKVGPYNPGDFIDEDDEEWNTSKGFRVFSIAYASDLSQTAFGCCIDINGECCEHIRLPRLLRHPDAYNEEEATAKVNDSKHIQDFIMRRKPHVVAISRESPEALMVWEKITQILEELEKQEGFPKIDVQIIDNELAKIYSISKKGEADFLDYPPLLRQAISIGRRVQDPLIEFSQLCNQDEELLYLKFHPLQSQLSNAELLEALYIEMVNRTNEVGVDLNRAVAYPYTQNLVQFICGLGPRKANQLLKTMKQTNQLENRNQLVVNFHMGPKVFINCAGFIKIDTNALGDSDNYIEVLDSTRIHPEAYDWARKMAVDALEYEDEEGKPAEALEEILETPDRLSELDLEAFATELQNQGFGKKNTTLYDIRHELNYRYKDFRTPYQSPTADEIFNMLTEESPVIRREYNGLWQCPFCLKNNFPVLSEVWEHIDATHRCQGQVLGIRMRLNNGISGFILIKELSEKVLPGTFMLYYLPRDVTKHDLVCVNPEAFRFRRKIQFPSLESPLKWFKNNFRGPIQQTPAKMSTRTDTKSSITGTFSLGYSTYSNASCTPSGQTPFMKPNTYSSHYGGSQTTSLRNSVSGTPSLRSVWGIIPQHIESVPSDNGRSQNMDWKMRGQTRVQANGGRSTVKSTTPRNPEGGKLSSGHSESRESRYQPSRKG